MILLIPGKYYETIVSNWDGFRKWGNEARIPENTPVYFDSDLPDEDDDGSPIFAFSVSAGETHYWKGEPLKLPEFIK